MVDGKEWFDPTEEAPEKLVPEIYAKWLASDQCQFNCVQFEYVKFHAPDLFFCMQSAW